MCHWFTSRGSKSLATNREPQLKLLTVRKKKKKLHLQKGQISADTSRLAENRVSGSLEFRFHLFILLSLNTLRYVFTHKPFSAAFKKTISHVAVPSPFSVCFARPAGTWRPLD